MTLSHANLQRFGKPVLFVLLALPALWLLPHVAAYVRDGFAPALGFNPPEEINRFTGDWALRILFLTLTITPFAKLIHSSKPLMFRRMIGRYAFFYISLHLVLYMSVDQIFDWLAIWKDIVKRTYITLGMTAFVLLIPLVATSTNWAMRKLKRRRWRRLHRLIYPAAILSAIHFIMMRKGFQLEPLIYAGILAVLLGYRLVAALKRRVQPLPAKR